MTQGRSTYWPTALSTGANRGIGWKVQGLHPESLEPQENLMATTTSRLAPVWYKYTDLQVTHGIGSWIFTKDGAEYLDFTAGIAVVSTGHSHPKVVEAIAKQAGRFIHAQTNCYTHDLLEPLAERLNEITPASIDTFFYSNSGAEITEAAVKLAKQATKRPNIIVFQGSFHGRTHLAMAMTTSRTSSRAGHAPLPSGIYPTPFPDLVGVDPSHHDEVVDQCLKQFDYLLRTQTAPSETAAVIMEPVLGEGGYIPAPKRFIEGIVARCKQHGILFIADEVQSGFGRTGKMFAVDHYGIDPDILCMAKGIASGFPFSALGARRELMDKWPTGSHGGTYGGNAIGCAASLATIEIMTAPGFMENVVARGEQLREGLRAMQTEFIGLTDVRGLGLMTGLQFAEPSRVGAIIKHAFEESKVLLLNAGTDGEVIRFMPPLVVTADEIEIALNAVRNGLKATA
jgi:4-aminobutyrate aminotransferase